jgi:hypothetical protein
MNTKTSRSKIKSKVEVKKAIKDKKAAKDFKSVLLGCGEPTGCPWA